MLKKRHFLLPVLVLFGAGAGGAVTLNEGLDKYRHGHFAEAETQLKQVCEAQPDDPAALEALALAQASMKKPEEAKASIAKAAEHGLAEDRVKAAQAKIAIEERNLDGAENLVAEAIEANPDNADALYYRGMIRVAKKDFAAAAADFERSLELEPDRPYAHYYAGIAYNGIKRSDKMVAHLQTFLRVAPDAPESDKVRSLLRAFR